MNRENLKIIPFGGCYEIGTNLMVLETIDDIIILDAGIGFPEASVYGIEVIIPDFSYIINKKDKVRAVFLTHGHEDHIGAIAFLLSFYFQSNDCKKQSIQTEL